MNQLKNTSAADSIRECLLRELPPLVARNEVTTFLGGLVSSKTLANEDSLGRGPMGAYKMGHKVVYPRESLVNWILSHFKISYLNANLKELI